MTQKKVSCTSSNGPPRNYCGAPKASLKTSAKWTKLRVYNTKIVKIVKSRVNTLSCLALADPIAFKIVETDASDMGYGGILKQKIDTQEKLVRYTSGTWNSTQLNYSTIKKEILSIVLCISKFQDDLLNQEFLLRVDCLSAKSVLQKELRI